MLTRYGIHGTTGRWLFALTIPQLEELPSHLELQSKHFVFMTIMDARLLASQPLSDLARWALNKGAVYVCSWGPDCERVHDLGDEVIAELDPNLSDETAIMTTWHEKESLDEALWFALNVAFPASAYEATCRSVLVLCIGNNDWKSQIAQRLTNPEFQEDGLSQQDGNG